MYKLQESTKAHTTLRGNQDKYYLEINRDAMKETPYSPGLTVVVNFAGALKWKLPLP
jgi:hypothetical protein